MAVIEDSINTDYPELSVKALFDKQARETLRINLIKDHKGRLSEDASHRILSEIVGLGFFEELIKDESITDIGYNGTDLWVKTSDTKRRMHHPDLNEAYILKIIQRFSNYVHQEFSEKSPILNAQLDNIRINAIHRKLSPTGTTMSMRHARNRLVLTHENWHQFAHDAVFDLLDLCLKIGINLVITGEVGTGKTELQKLLIGSIPDDFKLIMVEDTLETHLKDIYPDKDILSWLVAPGFSHTQFIKEALRNDPVYTVLSEARDHAIYEIHQSVLSGHKILLTAHSVNARAFIPRMIGMTKQKFHVDEASLKQEILRYYDFGIHLDKRTVHGKTLRFISEVVEYTDAGLQTLYSKDVTIDPQTQHLSETQQFYPLSDAMVDRLYKYGYSPQWNERIKER
ncbi:hypothetical protein AOC36_02040 [Erysipelothrix larvae]|uniref:Bacterial type II secretion system protein E domain-containing protein n=2 Tax=Erysipelothrix larvae TaxID=1514105 RepID=A0A109UGM1_9FIRM|nr:hypothetical protein AOC36_02040 [Erysipelothrix larvae]